MMYYMRDKTKEDKFLQIFFFFYEFNVTFTNTVRFFIKRLPL